MTNKAPKIRAASVYIVVALILLHGYSCSEKNNTSKNFRRIQVYSQVQLPWIDGSGLLNIEDSLCIFYYEDFVVYQVPVPHFYSYTRTGKMGEIIADKPIRTEIVEQYYVFRKGGSEGFKFDSLGATQHTSVRTDSFLAKRSMTTGSEFYKRNNDSLQRRERRGDTIVEIFTPRKKWDDSYSDTICFYMLNRKNDSEFSFSKEIEKEKNVEVVKVKSIYNARSAEPGRLFQPGREFIFERRDSFVNSAGVMNLIERCNRLRTGI